MLGLITRPIGCLLSFIGGLVLLCVLLIGLIAWAIKTLMVPAIASEMETVTGYGITMKEHELNFFNMSLEVNDMAITNPATDFSTADFLVVRRLFADMDVEASQGNTIQFSEVDMDIQRLTWVRNENYKINLEHFFSNILTEVAKQWQKNAQADGQVERFVIQKFTFKLDRVKLVTPNADGTSTEQVYDLNLTYEFQDISSFSGLIDRLAADLRQQGAPAVADSVQSAFELSP